MRIFYFTLGNESQKKYYSCIDVPSGEHMCPYINIADEVLLVEQVDAHSFPSLSCYLCSSQAGHPSSPITSSLSQTPDNTCCSLKYIKQFLLKHNHILFLLTQTSKVLLNKIHTGSHQEIFWVLVRIIIFNYFFLTKVTITAKYKKCLLSQKPSESH